MVVANGINFCYLHFCKTILLHKTILLRRTILLLPQDNYEGQFSVRIEFKVLMLVDTIQLKAMFKLCLPSDQQDDVKIDICLLV